MPFQHVFNALSCVFKSSHQFEQTNIITEDYKAKKASFFITHSSGVDIANIFDSKTDFFQKCKATNAPKYIMNQRAQSVQIYNLNYAAESQCKRW